MAAVEVLAATAFAEKRRRYDLEVAEDAELLRAWFALEREADRAQRRATGNAWARALGLTDDEGLLFEVLLYSPDVEVRTRAAMLIGAAYTDERPAA